ncbi:linear amide C-N hydrolase [Lysinibacter sp. HNR]|uniref:linear amide C-N hydrolase n=1 Tax=Lysinibacter sp. HNR TaxID=3031408 RepID=UPI002434F6BC|nr:linear amide C-N hydrolase [Lysinibacter sp. HNR]WGD36778.1 linear amide C-N hydrolase [Lysinibacter sp. HNR]
MCTRVVYLGDGSRILTARSMDWFEDIGSNLWAFPRGMHRDGAAGPNSITWTSRYGSIVTSAYDIATADGINEAGLVVNALWLAESEYPEPSDPRPGLSVGAWAQYVIDNFATVEEAVNEISKQEFAVLTLDIPGKSMRATVHLAISDASGDSAIFEYINGELTIHHGRAYQVMTNSPPYDQQLAINAYWSTVGGTVMLPGTNRASDRYARASFYINTIPQVGDLTVATAAVFGVIRNASVPYGVTTPDQPNIATTLWRTLADHKEGRYYFDSALSPSLSWVNVNEVDLSESGRPQQLQLTQHRAETLAGNVSDLFEPTEPFPFGPVNRLAEA